jgi:two-component system, sensor histidine kinase and response regulator
MGQQERINILLVDDHPEGLLALKALLDHPRYNLVTARSGHEALARLLDNEFAVILLDVQMPDMDGFETASLIKRNDRTRDLPIIFVTAISSEDRYVFRGYQCGAVDYIVKPFDPYVLKAKVAVFVSLYEKNLQIRRQAEDLKRQSLELYAINQELEAFSYSVSHDLRAPLRSIDGFSQALVEDCEKSLETQGKEYVQRIRGACQRMADLIDDLLALSRLSRAPMAYGEVSLTEMALAIAAEFQKAEPHRAVEVVVAPDLRADGDGRLLQVALHNLLSNAWKFTGKRDRARIEFGRFEAGGEPVFFVRDNGTGFDTAYAHKLFAPFQRLHDAKEFPGTGIGLAIVQRVIRRHGGRVWAESHGDQGAAFYFTVPRVGARYPAAAPEPAGALSTADSLG